MAEIQTLTATLSADVAQFLAGMQAAQAHAAQMNRALEAMAGVSRTSAQASEEHAGAIGKSVEMYRLAEEAAFKVAEGIKRFAEAAIEANNTIDPAAAYAWNTAVDQLHDSFTRFAANIGKNVAPVVEAVMGKLSSVFAKLSRIDWGVFGSEMLAMLKEAGEGIRTWAEKVADLLTWPFRQLVGAVEYAVADTLMIIGRVEKKLGGTAIGKKMGLDSESGSALIGTADDMFKQSAKIRESFGGAMSEVAKGFGDAMDAVLAKVAENPHIKKMADLVNGASGAPVQDVNDAADISLIEGARLRAEEMAKLYERVMGKTSTDQLAAATRGLELQRQASDSKRAAADYEYQQAMQSIGKVDGSYDKAAAAAEKIHSAMQLSTDAVGRELAESQKALDARVAKEKASAQAVADIKARADAALAANEDKNVKGEARALNDSIIQRYQLALNQLGQDRMFRKQTEDLLGQKKMEYAKLAGETELDYAKRLYELELKRREMKVSGLSEVSSAIGGVTGSIGNAAAQKFIQTGDPAEAAGAAIKTFLEASAGFKKLSEAINTIVQSLADSVGRFFEPLAAVVQQVGEAMKPLFDALGAVFGAAGGVLAGVLKPLVPVISALSNILAAVLQPVAALLNAIQPLIPIVVAVVEVMNALEFVALAPLIPVIYGLSAIAKEVAKVIKAVVDALASVWNAILHVLESVFDSLAHALPGDAGDAMRGIYDSLVGMEIHTDAVAQSADDASSALKKLANDGTGIMGSTLKQMRDDARKHAVEYDAMAEKFGHTITGESFRAAAEQARQIAGAFEDSSSAVQGLTYQLQQYTDTVFNDLMKKAQGDSQSVYDLQQAIAYAVANGSSQAVIDALQKQLDAAKNQQAIDEAKANAQGLLNNPAWANDPGARQRGQDQLSQALILEANTSATAANTKATRDLIASLTNAPSGFRVAMYEMAATAKAPTASSLGGTQKALGQSVQHGSIINGPVTIQVVSSDPPTAGKSVEKTLRDLNFKSSGQPVLHGGGKHS